MIQFFRGSLFGLVCLMSFLAAAPSRAADYPNRPVRLLIGFSAGGSSDTVLRMIAQRLSDRFGQQFVVENRTGAGGNLAATSLISSPPDGYTLMLSGSSYAIADSLYKNLPFNFMRDTVPVALLTEGPNMLMVSNEMPVKTVQEFIDYCKANPGKIAYASSGLGTTLHMSGELFKVMAKCDLLHVPYRNSAQMIPDLLSNKVQAIFNNLPSAMAQVSGGSARGLGVTSAARWPGVPNMPTVAESVPGYEAMSFYGMAAPKGTPPEIVEVLNKAINEALSDPKLVANLGELGLMPRPMPVKDYAKYFADQAEKWRKVVQFAGVSVD